MGSEARGRRAGLLLAQLRWFISLRWVAGATVLVGALVEWQWLQWYSLPARFVGLGVSVLGYNAALYVVVRRAARARAQSEKPLSAAWLITVSWVQILLDLGCLTLLTLWSGGGIAPSWGSTFFTWSSQACCFRVGWDTPGRWWRCSWSAAGWPSTGCGRRN